MNKHILSLSAFAVLTSTLAACGGGGGSSSATPPLSGSQTPTPTPTSSTPTPTPSPSSTPTPTSAPVMMAGTVRSLSSDGYGAATIASVTYQGGTLGAALANATVVIGTTPVVGVTPPATLPAGDVSTITNASGAFSISVPFAAVSSTAAFAQPQITSYYAALPTSGYFVEVFPQSADGLSAGVNVPVHAFLAPSTTIALQSTTPTSDEAGALSALNNDRAANGAGPLVFDEFAQEVARLHVHDMAANNYGCHYDRNNAGPASRYLAFGATSKTGESIALQQGTSPSNGFAVSEAAFMAEKTSNPPGGHYVNNVNPRHYWAGLGVANVIVSGSPTSNAYDVDYELVSPLSDPTYAVAGYTNAGCTSTGNNISVNQS